MSEMLEIFTLPFMIQAYIVCLILTGIHCYFGFHVLSRGVIFVDLSLAQIAAFGSAFGILLGFEHHTMGIYFTSLGFTFIGAAIFALTRMKHEDIPHEAIIGLVYAVFSAASILLLSKLPEGTEHIKHMFTGSILTVTPKMNLKIVIIYSLIGVFHYLFRHRFLVISTNLANAYDRGWKVKWWDFLFYMSFGFVVTSSVEVAGVLMVFSLLVIPAVGAVLVTDNIKARLIIGWSLGATGCIIGIIISVLGDFPPGLSIVVTLGLLLLGQALLMKVRSWI